jgi:type VI secretion system secreted protein VgrG
MNSLADRMLANKRFDFSSEAFGADKFAVVEMEGFESISQPFRFTLTLVSDDASIDFDTMLSHRASFTIYGPEGGIRAPYHGVLAEFEQLHRADNFVFYRAVLVPRLWRLSLYRISEVYLDERPITETVRGVLESGRLNSADYDFRLTGTYRPRTFVCQYQETYLDFVSRWLEKEGIYYYFDHSGGTDKLVVIDDKMMHAADALPVAYRPDDSLDTGVAADSVRNFICRQKPLPHEVVLQDYNYRKAAVQLKARATVSDSGIGDVMLYGENFRDQQEGDRYAKLRAQELICGAKVYSGEGTAMGLRSGFFFTLAHHYRDDFNGRYLVTEVQHQGSQAGALLDGVASPYSDGARGGEIMYRNSFRAIPAATQFRPERLTAKPRVAGTMNATIDGEGSGQYAELDEYGQYKVQLPFDKTDKNANKSSARLRMASPYAGTDHGMHFPLHKDAEVLLSFIDGDPDQPVIVGSLANSENPNVVTQDLAQANRISTAGGNQMYMGDGEGKEVIWLHSPFHNSSIGIGSVDPKGGGSLWLSTAGTSESVTVGANNSVTVGPKTAISVGTSTALSGGINTNYTVGANLNVAYGQNVAWTGGRSVSLNDAESVLLKTVAKLQGSTSVKISGGMNPAVDLAVTAAKKSILTAAKVATAVNAALGVASGVVVAEGQPKPGSTETKGKFDIDNPWGWGPAAGQMGAAAAAGIGLYKVLKNGGEAIAQAVSAAPAYSSNIDLDIAGVRATSALPATPAVNGELALTPLNASMSVTGVAGASSVAVTCDTVTVLGTSSVKVTSPANVEASALGKVSISGAGSVAVATDGKATINGSAVSVDAIAKFSAVSTTISLQADATFSVTSPEVKFNGTALKFQGALIQLG